MVVKSSGLWSQEGSRASSPAPSSSPRNVVGSYELDGIPVQWDNHPDIRGRIRDNNSLVLAFNYEKGMGTSEYVNATAENVKLNTPVLLPLATLMASNELRIPSIEQLTKAVSEFFILTKLSRSDDHCYQEAWAIRRLIGRLKKFTYRISAPQDRTAVYQTCQDDPTDVCIYNMYTILPKDLELWWYPRSCMEAIYDD